MQPPASPEAVVQAVIEATSARQWPDVFAFIDAADLPRWRRVTLSMLRHFEGSPDGAKVFAEWGARNTSELEVLPDEVLFARWMQAFTLEARLRMTCGADRAPPPPPVRRVVLGSVREGDDLAHVVYREMVGAGTALRIATLRLTPDGWRVRVDHDLLGLASVHFGPPPPPPGAGTEG
jgi:hypothetical protein